MNIEISFKNVKNLNNISERKEDVALVLGFQRKNDKAFLSQTINVKKKYDPLAKIALDNDSFNAKSKATLTLKYNEQISTIEKYYKHAVAFGVGYERSFYPRNFLRWGGSIGQLCARNNFKSIDVNLDSFYNPPSSASSKDAPRDFADRPYLKSVPKLEELFEKMLIGFMLSNYQFTRYKSEKNKKINSIKIRFFSQKLTEAVAKKIILQATQIAESICFTRDLQNIPGNDLYPELLYKEIAKEARSTGFKVRAFDEKKLKSMGMNGILTVGRGSSHPPRLIILEHNAEKKNLPTVVIVGKGVTFDTGGISLKPAVGMEEMKMDMSGAAATAGIVRAASQLKLPIRLIGLIPSAENKPGADSVNPGDIYTAYSGLTVEVLNTDAEGRLVLGDALSYAKEFKPNCVFDIATLTGAVCVALGAPATGVMGNHAKFIEEYQKLARVAGEETELPLFKHYHDDMKSKVADIRNLGSNRDGGAEKAAAFLNFFVKNDYPWIHLDVAATAMTVLPHDTYNPKSSGTGIPVASIVEFLRNFKKSTL